MAHGHIYFMLLKPSHLTESQMSLGHFSVVLLIENFIHAVFLWYGGVMLSAFYMWGKTDRLRLKLAFNLGSKSEAPKMIYFVEYLVQ